MIRNARSLPSLLALLAGLVACSGTPVTQATTLRLEDFRGAERRFEIRGEPNGILIIDDYGHWTGARQAVDEYFGAIGRPYYLHRVDYTGRVLVK